MTEPATSKETQSIGSRGATDLPQARIKRIIKQDRDVDMTSNDAVFAISVATELFIQRLAKSAHNIAAREKRKQIQYKDVAECVSRIDQFEFLADVVPQTVSKERALKKHNSAKKAQAQTNDGGQSFFQPAKKSTDAATDDVQAEAEAEVEAVVNGSSSRDQLEKAQPDTDTLMEQ